MTSSTPLHKPAEVSSVFGDEVDGVGDPCDGALGSNNSVGDLGEWGLDPDGDVLVTVYAERGLCPGDANGRVNGGEPGRLSS